MVCEVRANTVQDSFAINWYTVDGGGASKCVTPSAGTAAKFFRLRKPIP